MSLPFHPYSELFSSGYTPKPVEGQREADTLAPSPQQCPFAALAKEQTRLRFDPLTGASWFFLTYLLSQTASLYG